jgi:hypothetical protein
LLKLEVLRQPNIAAQLCLRQREALRHNLILMSRIPMPHDGVSCWHGFVVVGGLALGSGVLPIGVGCCTHAQTPWGKSVAIPCGTQVASRWLAHSLLLISHVVFLSSHMACRNATPSLAHVEAGAAAGPSGGPLLGAATLRRACVPCLASTHLSLWMRISGCLQPCVLGIQKRCWPCNACS